LALQQSASVWQKPPTSTHDTAGEQVWSLPHTPLQQSLSRAHECPSFVHGGAAAHEPTAVSQTPLQQSSSKRQLVPLGKHVGPELGSHLPVASSHDPLQQAVSVTQGSKSFVHINGDAHLPSARHTFRQHSASDVHAWPSAVQRPGPPSTAQAPKSRNPRATRIAEAASARECLPRPAKTPPGSDQRTRNATIWLHSPVTRSDRVTLTRKPYRVSGVRSATRVFDVGVGGTETKVSPPFVVYCQVNASPHAEP
jgi:hypothetical protein